MTRREHIVRHGLTSEHLVQFFDTRETLADSVAAFIAEGCRQGEALLVVTRAKNWVAIAAHLRRGGLCLANAANTAVTVLDADRTLAQFMRHGLPDSVLFHQTVGAIVHRLARKHPRGCRIYGEMVEVLAEEGNFHAAQRLEELWNELAVRHSFILLCGYSSAHFTSRGAREALMTICQSHTHVHKNPADPMAEWLLEGDLSTSRDPDGDVGQHLPS